MQFVDKISDFADAVPEGQGAREALESQLIKGEYDQALKDAEARSTQGDAGAGKATALQQVAVVKHVLGKLDDAKSVAEESLAAFKLFNSGRGEAIALHTLARISLEMEKLDEAATAASDAKAKFKEAACKEGEGAASVTCAKVLLAQGDVQGSLSAVDDAIAIFQGLSSKEGHAAALTTKATVRLALGEFADASKLAEEAASICQQSSHPSAKYREEDAVLLTSSAALAQQLGQDGLEKAKAALALSSSLGKRGKAMALQAIAGANLELWDLEEAVKAIDEAIDLRVGDKQVRASVLSTAARVYRARLWKDGGEMPDLTYADVALQKAKDAVALYQEIGQARSAAIEMLELSQMHMECGNSAEAMQEGAASAETFNKLGDRRGEAVSLLTTSELYYNKGDLETALSNAKGSQRTFKEFGADDLAAQANEVIKFLETQIKRKQPKVEQKVEPEKAADGQVKNSTYSQMIKRRIQTPECEPLCFDMPNILYMGLILGINIPFLPDPTQGQGGAPSAPPPPRPAPGKVSAANAPASAQLQEARRRQEARAADAEKAELEEPKKLPPPAVMGNDVLGGRARDVSEELHNKMLGLARDGSIPSTNPDKRAQLMLRKPTFHGPAEWREAVAHGYLHPKISPPRGLKWKSLTVGWKLIPMA